MAIVSGRPVAYLAPHIPESVDIVGLYGLEWRFGGRHHTLREAEEWRPVIQELTDEAVARFGESVVEPKGLSLTIHYRADSELRAPMQAWVTDVAERTGAEGRPAKHSFEVHPPIRRDKGTAVVEWAADLDAVAYVGDDLGDLPAFDGLDVLAARGWRRFGSRLRPTRHRRSCSTGPTMSSKARRARSRCSKNSSDSSRRRRAD